MKILDAVEYLPNGGGVTYATKRDQEYHGVGPNAADGFTALSVRNVGATRRHHITVGWVHALTVGGKRHVLQVPDGRWKLRAQEIRLIVEGECEDWAREYFDPQSPSIMGVSPAMAPLWMTEEQRPVSSHKDVRWRCSC